MWRGEVFAISDYLVCYRYRSCLLILVKWASMRLSQTYSLLLGTITIHSTVKQLGIPIIHQVGQREGYGLPEKSLWMLYFEFWTPYRIIAIYFCICMLISFLSRLTNRYFWNKLSNYGQIHVYAALSLSQMHTTILWSLAFVIYCQ